MGAIAILQTVALTGLAGSRAIGVDVWAADGSPVSDRRDALGPSSFVAISVFFINTLIWLFLDGEGGVLTLYWLATPLIVLLDTVRILLLHANRILVSVAINAVVALALFSALMTSASANLVLCIYLFGTLTAVVGGFGVLRVMPRRPSLQYSRRRRAKSIPFLVEISLGSITQQILFMLLAILSSVEIAGKLRIAQTLLGPMAVIHAGLAPQLLRKLAQIPRNNSRKIALTGRNFGLVLAFISMCGALVLSSVMLISVGGVTVLSFLTGETDEQIPQVIALCGVILSSGGIILGTGTAARVMGLTGKLNRCRILLIAPQVGAVALAASTNNAVAASTGLAVSAVITAVASIFIVSWNLGPRGRHTEPRRGS